MVTRLGYGEREQGPPPKSSPHGRHRGKVTALRFVPLLESTTATSAPQVPPGRSGDLQLPSALPRTLSLSTRRKKPGARGVSWLNYRVADRAPLAAHSGSSERCTRREAQRLATWSRGRALRRPRRRAQVGAALVSAPARWLTCLHGPGVPWVPRGDHWGAWVPTTGFQELAKEGHGEGSAAPGAPRRRKGQEPEHRRPARGGRGDPRGGAPKGTASGQVAPDAPRGPALGTRRLSRRAQRAWPGPAAAALGSGEKLCRT